MHHAYLLVGDCDAAEEFLHLHLSERGISIKGSPDFYSWREKLFGINDARDLIESAAHKAFGKCKIFFIAPEKISLEAQNTLLKTFEDPIPDTHFFLVAREEELIIPTLRSRMQSIRVQHSVSNNEAEKFLELGPKERINYVKKFVDMEDNLSVFLDKLMLFLREAKEHELLKKVFEVRKFSDDRSTSSRLILEYLALVL